MPSEIFNDLDFENPISQINDDENLVPIFSNKNKDLQLITEEY